MRSSAFPVKDSSNLRPHRESAVMPLDTSRIREIYLMRAELEALATGKQSFIITAADLDDLQALNAAIGAVYDALELDVRALRAADLTFHRPSSRDFADGAAYPRRCSTWPTVARGIARACSMPDFASCPLRTGTTQILAAPAVRDPDALPERPCTSM